jgi:DNA-binding IclR family transcriptional regulator
VLEVLEYFAQTRASAGVSQIARALGYPQPSTSVLLASLAAQGYLHHDPDTRHYRPTLRVMLLGTWLHDELFGEGSLISVMEDLRRRTGTSVVIGMQQGVLVRYILMLRGQALRPGPMAAGIRRPICRAALGKALLLYKSDAEISRIARHANAEAENESERVSIRTLLTDIRRSRERGWTESNGAITPGVTVIAMPLPEIAGQPQFSIGLGTTCERVTVEGDMLVAQLRAACLSMGPRLVDGR